MNKNEIRDRVLRASSLFSDVRTKGKKGEKAAALAEALKIGYAEIENIERELDREPLQLSSARAAIWQLSQFKKHLDQYAVIWARIRLGLADDDEILVEN